MYFCMHLPVLLRIYIFYYDEKKNIYIYDRACVRATSICACTCIRVSLHLFTCINANTVSYVRMRACVCVRLRACLHADLIKTQNAFAIKIFQHSNPLWVQKISGCTIYLINTLHVKIPNKIIFPVFKITSI